ncbi:hypothetical protein IW262DRAFT_1302943 [Armillaria fumosa]|nr:hypothetical protein IW262DRAFT_1302943 [Armillaria fumosa]
MFQIWRDACWPLYHCHCKICERAKAAEGVVKIALEDVAQPVTAAAEIRLPSPEVNEAEADDEDPDYDSWTTKSTWGSIWDRYNLIPSRPGNAQMLSEQYDACCRLSKPVLLPKINSDFALPIPHLGCGSHCSWNTLRHGVAAKPLIVVVPPSSLGIPTLLPIMATTNFLGHPLPGDDASPTSTITGHKLHDALVLLNVFSLPPSTFHNIGPVLISDGNNDTCWGLQAP